MSNEIRSDAPPFGAFAPSPGARRLIGITRAMPDTWLGKRTAFALRQMVIRRLGGRPVDIEALGARMRLHPYNNVCEKRVLFTPQYFDAQERAILKQRIDSRPQGAPFHFIDVGANVGAYALFVAAHTGASGRIVAIEPQPAIFERLVTNVRLNPFGSVKALACAVADKTGEITLFIDTRNSGESSMRIVGPTRDASIRVPAVTLHDLVRQEGFTGLDAIKLDVEGAEDLILEPFLRDAAPALWPGLLIVENGSGRWQTDLVGTLLKAGYRQIAQTRLNYVFERDQATISTSPATSIPSGRTSQA